MGGWGEGLSLPVGGEEGPRNSGVHQEHACPPWSFWGPASFPSLCSVTQPQTSPHLKMGTADRLITPFAVTQRPALLFPVCSSSSEPSRHCLLSPPECIIHQPPSFLWPSSLVSPSIIQAAESSPSEMSENTEAPILGGGCPERRRPQTRIKGVGGT